MNAPTTAELIRGAVARALSLAPGLVPLGMLFGAVAVDAGFHITAVLLMSLFYLAGTAQFAAVGLHGTGAGVWTIIALVAVINSRYFLMSLAARDLAVSANARPSRSIRRALAFFAVEETYALQSAWKRQRAVPPHALVLVAAATASMWIAATLAGALVGQRIPDLAVLGLDYALPGLFVGLVGVFAENGTKWAVAAACAAIAGLLALAGLGTLAALALPPLVAMGLGRWRPAQS